MGGSSSKKKHSSVVHQDYRKLHKQCLKNKTLFYDDLFQLDVEGAEWLRPTEIVKNPKFFVGGASRFDVVQGANANCWLLVAMANLTMSPTLFHHVVPKNQSFTVDYAGIFYFNIWQCGKWVEVVVDDRLPTKIDTSGSKVLMFAHSKSKNEFWSALLEKAYAKLYGSYNELTTGWFSEAMVDFTGGICERVQLQPAPDDLESILSKSLAKSSFICVFMIDDPYIKETILYNGLVKGHAYGVTKVKTVSADDGKVFLLRLRNPWGKVEWNGAWSDGSPEWNSISNFEKNKIGLVSENDGEFWMSLSDFSLNFEYIDICHLTPSYAFTDGKHTTGWESHFFKGEWTKKVTAGGISKETFYLNPQYRISLRDTDEDSDNLCTVLIGLLQKNKTRKVWHKIGVTAFRLDGAESRSKKKLSSRFLRDNFENSISSEFKRHREIVIRDTWVPGEYCIIPSTYKPNEEGQYLLRVYSEKEAVMDEAVSTESVLSKPVDEAQRDRLLQKNEEEVFTFFEKIAGDEKELGWDGLQMVLEYALTSAETSDSQSSTGIVQKVISWATSWFSGPTQNKLFTKDECRSMVGILDDDGSGRLSIKEFQILWRKLKHWESIYLNYSNGSSHIDATELKKALKEIGFNVKTSELSSIVRKYGDNEGSLTFDDFVMCSIELTCSEAETF